MPKAVPVLEVSTETPTPPVRKRGGKPVALEEHTVVTKWAEEKKIDNKPKPAARKAVTREPDIEADEDEIDEIYSDLPDDLALFLQNNSGQREVTMEVREIPGPRTDVSPGIRAGIYHANHRFDVDTHQDDLALYYAKPDTPTRFMLRLKCGGQYVPNGTIFPVDVIGASVERKLAAGVRVDLPAPAAPAPAPAIQAAPTAVASAPQSVVDRVAEVAQLVELFTKMGIIPKHQNPPPAPAVLPAPVQSEEDILIRAMLASEEAQKRVSNGLLGKLFGNGTASAPEMPWYGEIAKDLLMGLTPGLNALMTASAQQMARAQTFVAQQNGAQSSLPEAPQATLPAEPTPAPEPQQPVPPSPYEVMLRVVIAQRKLPAPLNQPHRAAVALWSVYEQHSYETANGTFNPFDEAFDAFVSVTPEECLTLAKAFAPDEAAVIDQPDAPQWLAAVQDEIRKEWNNAEEESAS